MITLTPITEKEKLEEYYQFRYRIYKKSRLKSFLDTDNGMDKDRFDEKAWHYGWYQQGKLVGCVRFVESLDEVEPIQMLGYMSGEQAIAVEKFIEERRSKCERMIEVSRFCLHPEYRGLHHSREFVLAMMLVMQPQGVEHGLFDCHKDQMLFYEKLGFHTLINCRSIPVRGVGPISTFIYHYPTQAATNQELQNTPTYPARNAKAAITRTSADQ